MTSTSSAKSPAPQSAVSPAAPSATKINKVVVHPLVLLSVVDHYTRLGKVMGGQKRVVGLLLGHLRQGVLNITNGFAAPFEEDANDKDVWFLDHDYLECMFQMFKKVNARERVVGWYHSGPKLCQNDIAINELFRKYNPNSVLVIVDVKPADVQGLPTEAYVAVDEVHDDGTPTCKTFEHLPSEIGAEEAEEVGVEHLLRDIKDTTISTLSQRITRQIAGLHGLHSQLGEILDYMQMVADGRLPINELIVYQLQDIFNLLPDISVGNFVQATYAKTNDQMLVVYLASLIRCVLALHDLINNKLTNRETEIGENDKKPSAAGDKKASEKAKEDSKAGESKDGKDSSKDSAKEKK